MDDYFKTNSNVIIQDLHSQIFNLNNQCINYQMIINEKENQLKNCYNEYDYQKLIFEQQKENFDKIEEENKREIEILKKKIIQIREEDNKTIDELRKENFKIKNELKEKEKLFEIKENEINKCKNQNEDFNNIIENYKKQIYKIKNEYFILKQILNDKENEIKGLYELKRKFNLKDIIEKNSSQFFDYNNYNNLKLDFTELNTKYKRLKEEKEQIFINHELLKNKLKNYDGDIREKILELNEKKTQYEQNLREIILLKNENEELKKLNNQYKETFNILNTQNKTLLYKSTLEEASSNFLSTNLSTQQYKDYLYKNIDELSNKINDLIEKNKELKKKEENFSKEKNDLNKEIENYKNTISQMQNYMKELEEINESQKKKNLILKSASCTVFLDENIPKNKSDSIEESLSFKNLLQQNKELNDKLLLKEENINKLKDKVKKLEDNYNNLLIENNSIKENNTNISKENNNLYLNISSLEKEKNELNNNISKLINDINLLNKQKIELNKINQMLNIDKEKLKNLLDDISEKTKEQFSQNKISFENKINLLNNENQILKQSIENLQNLVSTFLEKNTNNNLLNEINNNLNEITQREKSKDQNILQEKENEIKMRDEKIKEMQITINELTKNKDLFFKSGKKIKNDFEQFKGEALLNEKNLKEEIEKLKNEIKNLKFKQNNYDIEFLEKSLKEIIYQNEIVLKEKDKISKQIEEYNLKHPINIPQINEDKNKMDIEEEKEEEKNEEKKEAKEEEKKTTNAKTDINKLPELKPFIHLPDSLKNIKKNEDEKKWILMTNTKTIL